MKYRGLVTLVLAGLFVNMHAQTATTVGPARVNPASVPKLIAPAPADTDLDDILDDMEGAVRVSEDAPTIELPDSLPRFQRASALPIKMVEEKENLWNEKVDEAEDIISDVKEIPDKVNRLKEIAKELREIYKNPGRRTPRPR